MFWHVITVINFMCGVGRGKRIKMFSYRHSQSLSFPQPDLFRLNGITKEVKRKLL